MSYTIALAGKGGTGKTTIASLIIRYLIQHGMVPVLAIDADANANLSESLGVEVRETVGQVLASFNESKLKIPSGLTKGAYLEMRLNDTVSESTNVDLISMGRGEGTGCYCYPNTVLRKFIDQLLPNYPFMVMDNEAGLEHLSRGTTEGINHLIVTADHSIKGVRTASRILELVKELNLNILQKSVIITRTVDGIDVQIYKELEKAGIEPSAAIPADENITRYDLERLSLLGLGHDSKAVKALDEIMPTILNKAG